MALLEPRDFSHVKLSDSMLRDLEFSMEERAAAIDKGFVITNRRKKTKARIALLEKSVYLNGLSEAQKIDYFRDNPERIKVVFGIANRYFESIKVHTVEITPHFTDKVR